MENFAHIYLAFNQDCDRSQPAPVAVPPEIPTSWAAPITDTVRSTSPTSSQEAPTVQEPDVDSEAYAYPSFYL